jgi:hypothetical protein
MTDAKEISNECCCSIKEEGKKIVNDWAVRRRPQTHQDVANSGRGMERRWIDHAGKHPPANKRSIIPGSRSVRPLES